MKFSNQIIVFTTSCVLLSALLILVGGTLTFRQLVLNTQEHRLESVVEIVDQQLHETAPSPRSPQFSAWLPSWLRAHNIQRIRITYQHKDVFNLADLHQSAASQKLVYYSFALPSHPGYILDLWVEQPFRMLSYQGVALWWLIGGIAVVVAGVFGVTWRMKRMLSGAERLEARGNSILAGRLKENRLSSGSEWPNAASKALSCVIDELLDARKERSRFDCIIRHNAFVDELTQLSNSTHFFNQLEAEIAYSDDHTGIVLLIYLRGMDDVNYQHARSEGDALLQQCATTLERFHRRNIDAKVARFSGDAFSVVLPMMTLEEAEAHGSALMKQLERIVLPEDADQSDFFYIGGAGYRYGDDAQWLLEEAEQALRIAQMQRHNAWYFMPRQLHSSFGGKGSVRWRTTLQYALEQNSLYYMKQPMVNVEGKTVGVELLARLSDPISRIIHATVFMPWVEKSGMQKDYDLHTLRYGMAYVRRSRGPVSLNLSVTSVVDRGVMQEILHWAFSVSAKERNKLILEFSESQLTELSDTTLLRLKALNRKGIKLAVQHAGQQVVTTQYLSELRLEYLKLHASLIRDIQLRQVNRLAVSSILASCSGRTEVIAVGVERNEEWRVLQRLGIKVGQGLWLGKPEAI